VEVVHPTLAFWAKKHIRFASIRFDLPQEQSVRLSLNNNPESSDQCE